MYKKYVERRLTVAKIHYVQKETQKINMEVRLLDMKQINILNIYQYFYNNYVHRGKYGGA